MNYLHSRKPYFKNFSASLKMITELIELYLVKLQFMVVIKIVNFVFFYQYSTSFICSVYCISLSIAISFFIYIYIYIYIYYVCVCMYAYMCICVYMFIHIYVCVICVYMQHIHTLVSCSYIFIYIYIYRLVKEKTFF